MTQETPKEKLAIIIPTKDRQDKIADLLESISIQNIKPVQIVVVDGGEKPLERDLLNKYSDLHIDYLRSVPASLTTQRNAGIMRLCRDATLVGFLDDDIILEKDAIPNIMRFWEGASQNTGGAAFNLTNEIYKKPHLFEKIFFVNTDKPSRILRSGFQSKVSFQNKTLLVDWLVGCVMVWRRNIFDEFMFDEWFTGYARYEDVDFSYRVGRKYKMFIVADARARHLNTLEKIEFSFALGKMEIVNRLYFAKKSADLSLLLCCWACLGLFINNIVKGLFTFNKRYILRSRGNIAGFEEFLFRHTLRSPKPRKEKT